MEKYEYVMNAYNSLRHNGIVHTQKEFASLLGMSEGSISRALKGDESYLTDNLIGRIEQVLQDGTSPVIAEVVSPAKEEVETLLVIPTGARGGTLGDFADSVMAYQCEKMISPIKGADYAMQVTGDSMSPEYPNGSQIIIKRINEKSFIEWGKVYVLDTDNGAVIKQIRKTDRDDVIECVSLNPAYQSFSVPVSDIKGWYRVLMVLALK